FCVVVFVFFFIIECFLIFIFSFLLFKFYYIGAFFMHIALVEVGGEQIMLKLCVLRRTLIVYQRPPFFYNTHTRDKPGAGPPPGPIVA
ncbi:hypothetical protein, partial [Enterobacter intestinihominis]